MSIELDASKYEIIDTLFIETADQNYLLARVCYFNGLYNDFFWNAAQSIEKYLKASLLLNGFSVKDTGHDLDKLFKEVQNYAQELIAPELIEPDQVDVGWRKEKTFDFVSRVNEYGSSNNRYNELGYYLRLEDLLKLDQLVFYLWRCVCQLNDYIFLHEPKSAEKIISNKDLMLKDVHYTARSMA